MFVEYGSIGERIWVMALSFDQTRWRLPTQLNNEGPFTRLEPVNGRPTERGGSRGYFPGAPKLVLRKGLHEAFN